MPPIKGRKADPTSTNSAGRLNTIGMPKQHLSGLLDGLDTRGPGADASVKRHHARWAFRQLSLRMVLEHPGGTAAQIQVACRNLSRGGASVLHSSFVYTGTGCTLWIPRLDGTLAETPGKVVRCSYIKGQVHELGISFESPIDLSAFVAFDPLLGRSSFERIDPSLLQGRLLAIMAGEIDQRILGHYLSETRLKIRFAAGAEDALAGGREGCDVIVLDMMHPEAAELFTHLRHGGVGAPVVAVGTSAGPAQQHQLRAMGADVLVLKPLSSDAILSALAECLLTDDSTSMENLAASGLSPAIIKNLVQLIGGYAAELRGAVECADAMRMHTLCQQIRSTALQLGHQPTIQASEEAGAAVSGSMGTLDAAGKVDHLIAACERLRQWG